MKWHLVGLASAAVVIVTVVAAVINSHTTVEGEAEQPTELLRDYPGEIGVGDAISALRNGERKTRSLDAKASKYIRYVDAIDEKAREKRRQKALIRAEQMASKQVDQDLEQLKNQAKAAKGTSITSATKRTSNSALQEAYFAVDKSKRGLDLANKESELVQNHIQLQKTSMKRIEGDAKEKLDASQMYRHVAKLMKARSIKLQNRAIKLKAQLNELEEEFAHGTTAGQHFLKSATQLQATHASTLKKLQNLKSMVAELKKDEQKHHQMSEQVAEELLKTENSKQLIDDELHHAKVVAERSKSKIHEQMSKIHEQERHAYRDEITDNPYYDQV